MAFRGSGPKVSDELLVAGVDVGGTTIEVGLVSADHRVQARAKALPTSVCSASRWWAPQPASATC